MPLKTYAANQEKKTPKPEKPTPSGVACTEKKCHGEMMWREPREMHPEITTLDRADCSKCGWRGWV